ncbi:MAG: hypothetical protein IKT79_07345 [Akkermansia sp.]|nr:hypothetical protein [Akkermansia sp.]
MSNIEAVSRLNSLRELERLSNTVPAVVGYRILQNIHALEETLAPYNRMRDNIIKKYSKDGKSVSRESDPAAFEVCTQEIEEVAQIEVEVEVQTFPFKLIENREFPLKTLFALDFMIEKSK